MLDFNDANSEQRSKAPGDGTMAALEKDTIRTALNERLERLVLDIWPSGKQRQNKYLVGDVLGGPGDSLTVTRSVCLSLPERSACSTM